MSANDEAKRDVVRHIEVFYRIARARRLSNSETVELAEMTAILYDRARHEFNVPVPEYTPRFLP